MPYKRKYSKRTRRTRRTRPYRRGSFRSRVQRIVRRNQETKYILIGQEDRQLYHDVGNASGPTTNQVSVLLDPFQYINIGTGRQNRIGDQIQPTGISIRLWLANKADRMDLLYRVLIVLLPRSINGAVTTVNNVDLFQVMDQATNNSTISGAVDTEKVKKVLVDRVYHLQNATGFDTKEVHMAKKYWIRFKRSRPIKYTATNYHSSPYVMALYVIPYDSYGTLQTDNVASCNYTARVYFKDA